MAPWSPPHGKSYYVWVPEGSCFPPSYLKRYLRGRYGPVATHLPSSQGEYRLVATSRPIERPKSRSRSLRRCASHCIPHTRVPDCAPAYIPLSFPPVRIRGKQRRWSLGAPPSYLSTEFIAHRLESQRIDAITGAQPALCDASNDDPSPPLPAIKVSTSTASIALSFPGSPEGSTPAPEPLALRRGQRMLAPLAVKPPQHATEDYPGIPTAFLGTPSAYSPHFHFTSSIAQLDANPIPIGDMISALRSQAASLKVSSPTEAYTPMLYKSPSSANSLSASSSDIAPSISDDDWAFAHDLMSRYGDNAQDGTPTAAKHRPQQIPSTGKSFVPKARSATQTSRLHRASVPAASSTPNNRPKSSLTSRTDLAKPRHSTGIIRQRKDYKGTAKHVSQPDSMPGPPLRTPSPVTPNHTRALPPESSNNSRREHSAKRPPGILKRTKSVRFADMSQPDDAKDNAPSESQPRTSLPKDAGGSPPLHPSSLRTSFLPEELEVPTPSSQPLATPTTEESDGVFTVDRRNSVQLAPSQTVNLRSSVPTTPGLSEKSSSSGGSRAAKRLSLLIREHDKGKDKDKEKEKEKENSPLALRSQKRARRNTEVDENSARRASRGSRKNRLSSPLKSFLERLRA